jgi:polyhydroxyalkanoate synthesis regulator phasin
MKDVISAAAGLAGFAIESARDLVQYMVRRGQMTQEEADKLIREAEEAHAKKPASERSRPTHSTIAAERAAIDKAARDAANAAAAAMAPPQRPGAFSLRTGGPKPVVKPVVSAPAPPPPAPSAPAAKPVAKAAAPTKPAVKAPAKATPAKTAPAKAASKPAAKAPAKSPSKGAASKPVSKGAKSAKAGAKASGKGASKAPAKKKR